MLSVSRYGWKAAVVIIPLLILAGCGRAPSAKNIADAIGSYKVDNVSCNSVSGRRGVYVCSFRESGSLMNSVARFQQVDGKWRAVR